MIPIDLLPVSNTALKAAPAQGTGGDLPAVLVRLTSNRDVLWVSDAAKLLPIAV